MLCSEASLVKLDFDAGQAVTLKCRAWSCPICQPERGRQLRGQAFAGKPTTFITLTVNPDYLDSPEARARALADAWRIIVRKAERRWGNERIPYLCVFEAQKSGEPHLHVLARCKWIDQGWLSKQMRDLMKAPVCDIRRVWRPRQVATYVTKYVGKDPHRFGTCKRYWCTQDWQLVKWERDPDPIVLKGNWERDSRDLATLEAAWTLAGWVCWTRLGMLWGDGQAPPFPEAGGTFFVT